MRKYGKIAILLFIFCFIILTKAKIVNAAEITVEKNVTATNGSVNLTITGLTLESSSNYEWAIEATNTEAITNWYPVVAPDHEKGEIELTVSVEEENQLAVLKSTNTGYITIRKKEDQTDILKAKEVDLELPLMKAFNVVKSKFYDRNVPSNPAFEVAGPYGLGYKDIQYCFERITDASVVNGYIDKDHDLSGLQLKTKNDVPAPTNTNWKSLEADSTRGRINNKYLPSTDGLYYIWFRGSGTGIKTIYGQMVVEIGEVKRIEQTPNKGENDTDGGDTSKDGNQSKTNTDSQKKNDTTVANGILPQTGMPIGIILVIISIGIAGAVGYIKLRYYRDVK